MSASTRKKISENYKKLKRVVEKILNGQNRQPVPSLVLQPVRPKNLRGTDLY